MKLDDLNKWLTLIANFGVLIGIVFLVLEINQSNQIANRESRIDILSAAIPIEQSVLDNTDLAELRAKLRTGRVELSIVEKEQARSIAVMTVNRWSHINVAIETGFLPEANTEAYFEGVRNLISLYPGLAGSLAGILLEFNLPPGQASNAHSVAWEEILKIDPSLY